eukprot:CAMPEP_0201563268 /NCGR_PEP_ID=MMETSP0173_2-20130828/79787_1 /ASSEMBLY_ACC=CAM_ASM_000268 /TAXON_ID=218659 /ORGANISM="Vexillifera sp., Strain DIVA3 564/2" /LENGTH=218 /DNA_ID=CAMNT_0047977929 /DNA_START=94 /DNA_END=750 /DNA_ORIENTATION=-
MKQVKEKKKKRKRKKLKEGTRGYRLTQQLRSTVQNSLKDKVDLREAVKLPQGEGEDEWIATNAMEIYNNIMLVFENFVSDRCTAEKCPVMRAGPNFIYLWQESKRKKPFKLPAPDYIDRLLDWVGEQFSDETIFPLESDSAFGKQFRPTVHTILRKLFRVYAHIFCDHWERVKEVKAETELLLCLKHYYFFVQEFSLVDKKDFEPLSKIIARIENDQL